MLEGREISRVEKGLDLALKCPRSSKLLLLLHPDPAALAALPFSSLVVDVPLEFFHRIFAGVASHFNP